MSMVLSSIVISSAVLIYGLLSVASAGVIRTVNVDTTIMENLYLKLGQSTVLRFKEKPKKVVVGNQNYFNIEFVDNDLTIQPQERVVSNLFVYGEYHTYGLILNVGDYRDYDDLVNVYWRNSQGRLLLKEPEQAKAEVKQVPKLETFEATITNNLFVENRNLRIIDLGIKTGTDVKGRDVTIKVFVDGKDQDTTTIFENDLLKKEMVEKIRLIYQGTNKGAELKVLINGEEKVIAVPKLEGSKK